MEADDVVNSIFPHKFVLTDGHTCTLRVVDERDAEEILEFLPITHVETDFVNYLPGEFRMTVEKEREFIRDHTGKFGAIALAAVLDGRIVALGGATPAPHQRFRHQTEVGLAVLKQQWGQGIGREIMTCLIEWGRRTGLRKMYLRTFADNARARTLYEALGFVEEGLLKGDRQKRDGSYGDTIMMGLFYTD